MSQNGQVNNVGTVSTSQLIDNQVRTQHRGIRQRQHHRQTTQFAPRRGTEETGQQQWDVLRYRTPKPPSKSTAVTPTSTNAKPVTKARIPSHIPLNGRFFKQASS